MQGKTRKRRRIVGKVCEDRISALPEDLLVQILSLVPTEDAVATAMLSRQWRSIWKMLPWLEYTDDTYNESNKSVWWFLEKSLLQLSKAPVIESLGIQLDSTCPVDVDVGKWVDNVVDRCIQWLDFDLLWSAEPISLSKRLYTCKTLKRLALSNKILVDVPFQASLPSLTELDLFCVDYKGEESLVRLFSSCLVLQNLFVFRKDNDNVTKFSVKVPSLQFLWYAKTKGVGEDIDGSLVIDSPGLKYFNIFDMSRDSCLIENMPPRLDMATVNIDSHPNDKLIRCLSSVMYLNLTWKNKTTNAYRAINFSCLIECKLAPWYSYNWVESTMLLLHNSPQLKHLMIDSKYNGKLMDPCPHWSCVPGCLSSHLEIFEWKEYEGKRGEKKLLKYILANSKCLKTVTISLKSTCIDEKKKKKMMNKLESMYRISESSQLFFSTQLRWRSMNNHPAILRVMSL